MTASIVLVMNPSPPSVLYSSISFSLEQRMTTTFFYKDQFFDINDRKQTMNTYESLIAVGGSAEQTKEPPE